MSFGHDRPALLGRYHALEDGTRVHLRLARGSDVKAIERLLAAHAVDELSARSLVHFDPRRCFVLCACALIDSAETLVGLGAIELGGETPNAPKILIVNPRYLGVAELLADALIARARVAARARAA
jgi:hypothetical protein